MGRFLNSIVPARAFKMARRSPYFVDKTGIIRELLPYVGTENRFLCFSRPRRFGKTMMANMVAAYFGKAGEVAPLFDGLNVSKEPFYLLERSQYNLIYIDFSQIPKNCSSYQEYIDDIQTGIAADLAAAYPDLEIDMHKAVWVLLNEVLQKTGDSFIFVMDEWDAVFHMPFIQTGDKMSFLLFLKLLLKNQAYVELAYMTGVLPIAKYSSGSELNVFLEYDMVTRAKFAGYFGFLEEEVDTLYAIYEKNTKKPAFTRKDLADWYDGYQTVDGFRLYNPRSVVCALTDNQIGNYWTSSGPYDEIFYYIKNDIDHVKTDMALMISGEAVPVEFQGDAVAEAELNGKDLIFSAMVVYGLLTYKDGCVMIPNRELMKKFDQLLITNEQMGYVHRLARDSRRMLDATLAGDTDTMAEILSYAHDTESPILSYNHETELSAVVNLVYLSARDRYRVEREDKAGLGFVDFIFYPDRMSDPAIILELKVDAAPEDAIRQIKEKKYPLRFAGKLGEKPKYTGGVLAVGISYSRTTKKHACLVEELELRQPAIVLPRRAD